MRTDKRSGIRKGFRNAPRNAHARWEGTIKEGQGTVDFGNGAFKGAYSFGSRFEQGAGTNPEELLDAAGPPVGLFDNATYESGTVTLPERGTVLIYTDGVVEARNPADEEFGLARVIDVCARKYQGVDDLLTAVMGAVRIWSGACEQGDDITVVALAEGG